MGGGRGGAAEVERHVGLCERGGEIGADREVGAAEPGELAGVAPRARLAGAAIAPVIRSLGKCGAARMSAWPMRPVTPMSTARISGAGSARRP